MLGSRKIAATLAGQNFRELCDKGLSAGGVSPLMYSLVLDELKRGLNKNGCHTLEYADDVTILISSKFLDTLRASS